MSTDALNALQNLSSTVDLGPLQPLLDTLLGDVAAHLEVADFFESDEDGLTSYTLVVGVRQSILFDIPGFSDIQLGVVRDSDDDMPLILGELVVAGAPPRVAIRHFPLRVVIDNPLLLPVADDGDDAPALGGFSFEIEGALSIDASLEIAAELQGLSLPPFTIVGTGLLLGLDECRLITRDADVDDDITALGFDTAFRGFHAASAQCYWDIPFQPAGAELPGLRADLTNLALGNQGLSVAAALSWAVVHDGEAFDGAQTEILGELFGWEFAFEQFELVVERNVPIGTSAGGYLRVPFLGQILHATLGYRDDGEQAYRFNLLLEQAGGPAVDIPLGHPDYALQIADTRLEGMFTSSGEFDIDGRADIGLALPGLAVNATAAEFGIEHGVAQDVLRLNLEQVEIGDFGQVEQAQLIAVFGADDSGGYAPLMLELIASMQWQDIADRIHIDDTLPLLPMPPDDAEVTLHASWLGDTMQLSIEAALDDVDRLWRFLPDAARPRVSDASIDIALTLNGSAFDGEVGLAFDLTVPDLATLAPLQAAGLADAVRIDTGNADGVVHLRFAAAFDDDGAASLSAALDDPLALALQLPGIPLPEPPVQIAVTDVGIELSADGSDVTGILRLGGDFALHPILPDTALGAAPPLITQQLDRLLDLARQVDLVGSATLELGVDGDNAWFATECRFSEAGLEIDLFDMLAGTLTGGSDAFASDSASEIDLDIDVAIELSRIALSIGSPTPSGDGVPFAFGIATTLAFAGQTADLVFELTDAGLSFGLDRLRIPIAIPKLPLKRADLDRLRDLSGHWDYPGRWQAVIEPELDSTIDDGNRELDDALEVLQQYRDDGIDGYDRFALEFRTIPAIQKRLFDVVGRKFLYQAALAVHQMLGRLGVEGSQQTYQQSVEIYQDVVDIVFGSLHVDSALLFEISDVRVVLPFNDPSDIRVEGGAAITGFVPDDPLAPLGDLVFKLGISTDAIYFAVEGGAAPIALPDFGRYPGSAVHLDRLAIGYGYSKNSLKVDFAGELILSEQLIDDADTSDRFGAGIRLPRNSKLKFKLDLIPIVLGEVDFVIPLVAFDIDLRSDGGLPAPAEGPCRPAWDGLQLHVPGVVRADLKRYALSPFFGPLPAPNFEYAFDVELGNDDLGLRHVADYRVITPLGGTLPIPFLADTVPFFERYCMQLQLAGFGLRFDLARPFPKPGPLLIFELLGFLSDPTVPIDPNGQIAALMYAELHDARIDVPAPVLALFPAAGQVSNRSFAARVDVTTVIALFRQLQGMITQLRERVADSTLSAADLLQDLADDPPSLAIGDMLAALPATLRTLEVDGRFLHFDASATFFLALAGDIDAAYGDPAEAAPPPPPAPAYQLVYANDFSTTTLPGWQRFNHGLKRGKGNWRASQGQLTQNRNVGDNSYARYGTMLVYTAEDIGDLRLLVTASSTDNDGLGVVFHVQDARTFYRFRMTEEQNEWRLDKLVDGRVTTLFSDARQFARNTRYDIRVEATSLAGSSAGLARNLDTRDLTRRARPIDIDGLLDVGRRGPESRTRIRIWVNGAAWCDVDDGDAALTHGAIGLDSWWNTGAHFDDLQLFARWQPELTLGEAVDPGLLMPLSEVLSPGSAELPPAIAGFSRQDINAALSGAPGFAVVVAARVRLAGSQLAGMLGWIASDGSYRLVSRLNVPALQLDIAGITLPLPLEVSGRLTLDGRSAGADSYVEVRADVHGDWTVLPGAPGQGAIARVLVGTASDPVALRLASDREFAVAGSAELRLFDDQVVVHGDIDVSHAHAAIAGELTFMPEVYVAGQRLVAIDADVHGRIGPGRLLELHGSGSLSLFGRAFSAGTLRLAERVVELSAEIGATSRVGSWSPAGLPLKQIRMSLHGRIDFRAPQAALALSGDGGFKLHGAQIEGACRIETRGSDWLIGASGRLFWQGRNWLDGSLLLTDGRIELSGRADFAIRLTPTQLPAGVEIAGLHLHAAVSGRFTLNAAGQLLDWSFDLDWQLAVRLPGTDGKQALPIATQQLKVNGSHAASDGPFDLVDLVTFNGLTLFDLAQFEIPVPTLDTDGGQAIYLRNGLTIDVDEDGGSVTYLTPIAPDDDAEPAFVIPGIISFYEEETDVDMPALTLPVPVLSTQGDSSSLLFRVPDLTTTHVPLGQIRFDNTAFSLKLAWHDGKIGVRISGEDTFVPFANNLFLGIIVTLGSATGS